MSSRSRLRTYRLIPLTARLRPFRVSLASRDYIYLEQLGHIVFSARSKAEALKKIPRANCHVLISDINLPDGNGWEILEEIENSRPNYAIAISGGTGLIVKGAPIRFSTPCRETGISR